MTWRDAAGRRAEPPGDGSEYQQQDMDPGVPASQGRRQWALWVKGGSEAGTRGCPVLPLIAPFCAVWLSALALRTRVNY